MLTRLLSLPFLVILMGLAGVAMFVPAFYGYLARDLDNARVFFYGGVLTLILSAMIGIAQSSRRSSNLTRSHLLALLGAYVFIPVILAIPFYEAVQNTSFINAYFEMVSSFTTTGATLFDDVGRLKDTVHMWRATVGWLGGFFTWVTAFAILAPLHLGGFEVISSAKQYQSGQRFSQISEVTNPSHRLSKFTAQLFPLYLGLTTILWIALWLAGDRPIVAISHAMATIATSGISPSNGLNHAAGSGIVGEGLIFIFMFLALSRLFIVGETHRRTIGQLWNDHELRIGVFLVISVPVFLVLRHWVGAIEVSESNDIFAAINAFWGSAFTVLSFLTTTGFESEGWVTARGWSGLETSGLILLGLSIIGGGVATTAGGVKLMRIYALYAHGNREIGRLIHPHSVGGSGQVARYLRRRGAHVAWIFFMLFAISIALVMLTLSLTGIHFEDAMIYTIATLSTTGPLASVVPEEPLRYIILPDTAKMVLVGAMVLGRLETLGLIALLNPSFWRNG